jgi:hypothetical protein
MKQLVAIVMITLPGGVPGWVFMAGVGFPIGG